MSLELQELCLVLGPQTLFSLSGPPNTGAQEYLFHSCLEHTLFSSFLNSTFSKLHLWTYLYPQNDRLDRRASQEPPIP